MLDSRGWNQYHPMFRGDEQAGIHELVGKEAGVSVVKQGAEFESAGCGIDLVVQSKQFARGDLLGLLPIVNIHRQFRSVMKLVEHAGEIILGQGENHSDGLDLGDNGQDCAAAGLHEIARVDQAQADSPGERRHDVAVGKLHLVEIKSALIRPDQSLVLGNYLFLILKLLFRDGIAIPGLLIAIQIHFGLRQQAGIAFESAFGRLDLCCKLARINVDQRITLMNRLALSIMHLRDDTGDLVIDGSGIYGGDRADGILINADIALLGSGNGQRYRAPEAGATATTRRALRGVVMVPQNEHQDEGKDQQEQNPEPLTPPARRRGFGGGGWWLGRDWLRRFLIHLVLLYLSSQPR